MDIEFELLLSAKLVLAAFLGGIIGLERERDKNNMGIRTFACICVAACLFVSISAHLSEDSSAIARTLAAIATGLGFIGAGIIFRDERNMPKGLTTAAGLWTTSAVGVAIALNMYVLAFSATGLTLLIFFVNQFNWYRRFVAKLFSNKKE
ncbi:MULTISPECIES: MgtC/SapB family protein [Olivibacter]|jgi:putative Mg2+ transporter-C (MgtC) family protein|uniref:MgtC/SapB family protein n=1 Tax=Olivibacter oleidegradans TaxID=760123 RepID=A0ABV6HJF0_9SPHI|nr:MULTISPECIES: MgtC/SapB family protein [Olivibacter]MDM8175932.1 MgtC/SapB family protein [Olivibacter sp. 47]